MDASDYESRRKKQNREAQKRYRKRLRNGEGAPQGHPPTEGPGGHSHENAHLSLRSHDGGAMQYGSEAYDGSAVLTGSEMGDLVTGVYDGNQWGHSGRSTPHLVYTPDIYSNAHTYQDTFESFANDPKRPSTNSCATGSAGPDLAIYASSSTSSEAESRPLPRAHAKIYDEAVQITDDLLQHYEFCVEMQLMCLDEELRCAIHGLKNRFRSSIARAASESR